MQIRSQSGLRWAWVFAILWNLIAAPATLFGAVPAIRKGPGVAWVTLLFPLAGAALLIWAVHLTLAFRRFGTSLFDMAGEAAIVGRPLRGTITTRNLPEDATLRLTLTCIQRIVSGSGKSRSVNERVVWQDEQKVPPQELRPGPQGPIVPVAFVLPNGAPPSSDADPDNRILWRLQASAVLPGVDYGGQFEVPVAGSGADGQMAAGQIAGSLGQDALSIPLPAEAPARPESSCVVVEPVPAGGTCYILPAGRIPGMAIGLFLCTLLIGSIPVGILSFRPAGTSVSTVTTVFFALTLFLAVITLRVAFLSTRVTAAPGRLAITRRLLGLSWTRTLASQEIRDLRLSVGMQAGMTPYYDLVLELASGGRATVSAMLRDRREAEWLAGAIRCSLSR